MNHGRFTSFLLEFYKTCFHVYFILENIRIDVISLNIQRVKYKQNRIHSFIHTSGPSTNAPDAPQPWAYCATLKCSFSSDSAALCLLCRDRGLLLRLCLFLLVRQRENRIHVEVGTVYHILFSPFGPGTGHLNSSTSIM
jgi:hypothetical protein